MDMSVIHLYISSNATSNADQDISTIEQLSSNLIGDMHRVVI